MCKASRAVRIVGGAAMLVAVMVGGLQSVARYEVSLLRAQARAGLTIPAASSIAYNTHGNAAPLYLAAARSCDGAVKLRRTEVGLGAYQACRGEWNALLDSKALAFDLLAQAARMPQCEFSREDVLGEGRTSLLAYRDLVRGACLEMTRRAEAGQGEAALALGQDLARFLNRFSRNSTSIRFALSLSMAEAYATTVRELGQAYPHLELHRLEAETAELRQALDQAFREAPAYERVAVSQIIAQGLDNGDECELPALWMEIAYLHIDQQALVEGRAPGPDQQLLNWLFPQAGQLVVRWSALAQRHEQVAKALDRLIPTKKQISSEV